MIIYWKKVRGHSRQPGQAKDLNDQTEALAKAGALHGEFWTFHALPPNPSVTAVTRRQNDTGADTTASSQIALSPQFAADDHCAKARSTSRPKGDDADTRTKCTMHRTPRCQGHL